MRLCRHTVPPGVGGWGLALQLVLGWGCQLSQAPAVQLLLLKLPTQPCLLFVSTGQGRVKKCHLGARGACALL